MNAFARQHTFSPENIERYFLSPYCAITAQDGEIYLERRDLNQLHRISGSEINKWMELLSDVRDGLAQEVLVEKLSELGEEDPCAWIRYCLQGGILE